MEKDKYTLLKLLYICWITFIIKLIWRNWHLFRSKKARRKRFKIESLFKIRESTKKHAVILFIVSLTIVRQPYKLLGVNLIKKNQEFRKALTIRKNNVTFYFLKKDLNRLEYSPKKSKKISLVIVREKNSLPNLL